MREGVATLRDTVAVKEIVKINRLFTLIEKSVAAASGG